MRIADAVSRGLLAPEPWHVSQAQFVHSIRARDKA